MSEDRYTRAVIDALGVDMQAPLREWGWQARKKKNDWVKKNRRPCLNDFAAHFAGLKVTGHTTGKYVHVVSVDLDAHGLLPFEAQRVLSEKYSAVCAAFGLPALVVRTREGGGLHCYWWLDQVMDFYTLRARICARVPGVEVLPVPRRGNGAGVVIRTPGALACGGAILSPVDLNPVPVAPGAGVELAILEASKKVVSAEHFLGLSKEVAKVILRNGPKTIRRMRHGLRMAGALERAASGIRPGYTNEKIMAMVRVCVLNGYSLANTHAFIRSALDHSRVPLHEDTEGPALLARVNSLYKNCRTITRKQAAKTLRPGDPSLFTMPRADAIVEKVLAFYGKVNIKGRRLGTLRQVARSLVRCVERIRELNEKDLRLMDAVFPGFYHKVRIRGLVPLPRDLWRKWVPGHNYMWYQGALLAVGVIVPSWSGRSKGSGYCPGGLDPVTGKPKSFHQRYAARDHGTCRYFVVNLDA